MFQRIAFLPVHQPVARIIENPVVSILGITTNKLHIYFTFLKRVKDPGAEMRACVVSLDRGPERQRLRRGRTKEHLRYGALSVDPRVRTVRPTRLTKELSRSGWSRRRSCSTRHWPKLFCNVNRIAFAGFELILPAKFYIASANERGSPVARRRAHHCDHAIRIHNNL